MECKFIMDVLNLLNVGLVYNGFELLKEIVEEEEVEDEVL